MPSLNRVQIIGHLGRDPETKFIPSGKSVANFSVAVSEKYNGNESTEWFNVVAWEKTGEIAQKYLRKGNPVYVEGRLKTREWEKDGEKRKTTDLVATNIVLLGSKNQASDPVDDTDIPF